LDHGILLRRSSPLHLYSPLFLQGLVVRSSLLHLMGLSSLSHQCLWRFLQCPVRQCSL
jgi:hypothetical protein